MGSRQPAGREGSGQMSAVLNLLRNPRVALVAQIWIGLVFLAAALGKISDPAAFAKQIHYFRLLPGGLENTVAIMLPWIELIAALALLLRAHPRSGAIVTAGLMVMFVVVVAAALARVSTSSAAASARRMRAVSAPPSCWRTLACWRLRRSRASSRRSRGPPCSRSRSRHPIAPRSNRHAISAARSAGGTRGCRAGTRNPDRCGPGRQPAVPPGTSA